MEYLAGRLADYPQTLLFLVRSGLKCQDFNARWQLAHRLHQIAEKHPAAEELILAYYRDQDEYVKRRALLALGHIKSRYAEECAIASWNTGMDYQRIAAIHVLFDIGSDRMKPYIESAAESEVEAVRNNGLSLLQQLAER